uniref:Uncharacterized protein n=1 Tax=Panagrolaimus sp. ES5 TaxID=591445 RepID=A0AC34FQL8_9BILA
MFIPQSYPYQNTYEDYTRSSFNRRSPSYSRRSRSRSRSRSRGVSRHSRRRSPSYSRESRSPSRMYDERRSRTPSSEEGEQLDTYLGDFKDNLFRRTFITGCIRPPTPNEVKTLCNFITTIRTDEIKLFEQIDRAIKHPPTKNVFAKTIVKLSAAMDTSKVERQHYAAFKNIKEAVDISVFVVFFWNMFVEIHRRDLDVILRSRTKILDEEHELIFAKYKDYINKFKTLFEDSIDKLEMTDDSVVYFEKYKEPIDTHF